MPKPRSKTAKTAYILLFRGVGGATQLPTAPLREALTAAGFENIATYINSGNAVLRSELPREMVIARVAEICKDQFSFTKAIFAPTLDEWTELIDNNPFPDFEVPRCLHAAVLADQPRPEAIDGLRALATPGEGIEVVGQVAYLHTPAGFGKSKLAEKFDKGIGVTNSARNWNTVLKLLELAKRAASP